MTERLLEENKRLARRCIELESLMHREVERLRAANERLLHGKTDLRVLLQDAAVGVALVDMNLRIASANRALANALGYAVAELPGVTFSNFVYVGKLSPFTRLVNRSATHAGAEEIIELVARDGTLLPCRLEAGHWLDNDGAQQGHILLVFDARTEVLAGTRLREAEQALAEVEWGRRLVLESLGGATERLSRRDAGDFERLVMDVLDIVRTGRAGGAPRVSDMAPADLAESVLSLFRRRAEEKGVALRAVVEEGVPATLTLESGRLRRALAHLVDNALRNTEQGEVLLRMDVTGGWLRLMVSDTGGGLPADTREALIRDSLSPEAPASLPAAGGLAACRRFVAAMGGRFAFESAPGEGSEFHILLPLETGR